MGLLNQLLFNYSNLLNEHDLTSTSERILVCLSQGEKTIEKTIESKINRELEKTIEKTIESKSKINIELVDTMSRVQNKGQGAPPTQYVIQSLDWLCSPLDIPVYSVISEHSFTRIYNHPLHSCLEYHLLYSCKIDDNTTQLDNHVTSCPSLMNWLTYEQSLGFWWGQTIDNRYRKNVFILLNGWVIFKKKLFAEPEVKIFQITYSDLYVLMNAETNDAILKHFIKSNAEDYELHFLYFGTTLELEDNNNPCLSKNTMINTTIGSIPIQSLKTDDYILDQNNNPLQIKDVIKTNKLSNKFNILKKNSLASNVPNKNLIISDLHIVKHNGKIYLPKNSNKFCKLPEQMIEFYHIETEDYINDWFWANNCLVETFTNGENKSHLQERMKRLKQMKNTKKC